MDFTPDARMQVFVGCETYESFLNVMLPDIWLNVNVSEDVKKNFRVIRKLLEHSYYEYEFCDMAATKALMTTEMALKIRYRELTKELWSTKDKNAKPKRNLKNLIDWFNDKTYFEVYNPCFLDKIRAIRNYLAHPENFSFGGPIMIQWVEHSVDLINDIYEDPDLRKIRFAQYKQKSVIINKIVCNGVVLKIEEDENVLYSSEIVFVDNKGSQILFYLSFIPLDIDHKDNSIRKDFIPAVTTDLIVDWANKQIEFKDLYSNKMFTISQIRSSQQFELYNAYKNLTDPMNFNWAYIAHLHHNSIKYAEKLRRDFHRRQINI
jgi:hypothetical protein